MSKELLRKPVGIENPKWLDKFYCQWQEEHPEIEAVIDQGVTDFAASEYLAWVKEGLRLTHFGIFLTQLAFPGPCSRVAYPPVSVREMDYIAITSVDDVRPVEIILGYQALLQKENIYSDEGMAETICTAVEEYAHWVRGILAWTDPQRVDRLRRESHGYDLARDNALATNAEVAELADMRWLREIATSRLTSDQIRWYLNDLVNRQTAAFTRFQATPEEYMAILWQMKVCKKFFPWSQMRVRLLEEHNQAYKYKLRSQRGRDSSTPV